MGRNYFTEEQQRELQKNPYIQKVSSKSITYTKEFKEKFEEEYRAGNCHRKFWMIWGLTIAYSERNEKTVL